jgi:hypothetical protein
MSLEQIKQRITQARLDLQLAEWEIEIFCREVPRDNGALELARKLYKKLGGEGAVAVRKVYGRNFPENWHRTVKKLIEQYPIGYLAKELQVAPATLISWRTNKHRPQRRNRIKVAKLSTVLPDVMLPGF